MDFKDIINKAREEGMTLEDIKDSFNRAVNDASSSDDFYDELDHEFWNAATEECFDSHDVAILAALVALDDHDWDKETTERFIKLMEENFEYTAKLVSMKPREAIGSLFGELFDLLEAD